VVSTKSSETLVQVCRCKVIIQLGYRTSLIVEKIIMQPAANLFDSVARGSGEHGNSILYNVLKSEMDPDQKTLSYLENEILGNILAGTEAVANTMLTIMFHLARSPSSRELLRLELQKENGEEDVDLNKLPVLVCRYPGHRSLAN
jgi:cytochrome P450